MNSVKYTSTDVRAVVTCEDHLPASVVLMVNDSTEKDVYGVF